jgi:hypothetical protein
MSVAKGEMCVAKNSVECLVIILHNFDMASTLENRNWNSESPFKAKIKFENLGFSYPITLRAL